MARMNSGLEQAVFFLKVNCQPTIVTAKGLATKTIKPRKVLIYQNTTVFVCILYLRLVLTYHAENERTETRGAFSFRISKNF